MGSLELGLKEFEIIQRYESEDYYKFEIKCKDEPFMCTECMHMTPLDGSWKFKLHDVRKRTVIDERLRRKKVVLEVHQRRYKCPECGKRFVEFMESLSPFDKVTRRLWFTLGEDALVGNFKEVGEFYGLSDTTVKKSFDALIVQKDKERTLKAPRVLGIDEIYVRLEQGKSKEGCAVFTDIENHKIIEFIRSVRKTDVIDVIKSMYGYEDIEIVTMDMASGYRNAVRETLPKAFAVIDHFHVIQKCNMAIDVIRNQARTKILRDIDDLENKLTTGNITGVKSKVTKVKTLRNQKNEDIENLINQLNKDNDDLYNARHLFRFGNENLSEEQMGKLFPLLEKYKKLNNAYWIKEGLRDVYACQNKYDANQKYFDWEQLVKGLHLMTPVPEMVGIQKMINRMRKEVFAFFDGRYTNAYAESFNSIVKEIVRVGKGYRFESLRGKVLYGTSATKPAKLKEMNFHAIEKVFGKELNFTKSQDVEEYTEDSWLTVGFGVDFVELLSIFQEGKFRT